MTRSTAPETLKKTGEKFRSSVSASLRTDWEREVEREDWREKCEAGRQTTEKDWPFSCSFSVKRREEGKRDQRKGTQEGKTRGEG